MKTSAGNSGMALAVTLILMLVLTILCVTLDEMISADYRFAKIQQSRITAFYLAKSGMEYYTTRGVPENPIHIPPTNPYQLCAIHQDPVSSDLYFEGTVMNASHHVIAQRVLIAPGGDLKHWHE